MKLQAGSKRSFSNPLLSIGLCFVLLSSFLALIGSGAISRQRGNTRRSTGSLQTAATANVPRQSKEVPVVDRNRMFTVEYAPAAGNTTYLGNQDSVRKSTDGGLSSVTLNLRIDANDQVFDMAIAPSDPSILWAGIADALASQPVNVMRSTDGGATWTNRTPPHAPMSGRGIAIDPGDSNTVIAVFGGDFGGGEAWVSTDRS